MSKRKKKSAGIGWLIIISLLAFGVAAGGAYYYAKRNGLVKLPEKIARTSKPATVSVHENGRKVVIYLPEVNSTALYLSPVTRTTTAKGDILDAVMNTLLATNKEKGELGSLIPAGTRLLSPIKVSEDTATVNLSQEFIDNFSGGTDQEALTLNSIAHTLVNNSGGRVKRVQILVEGKAADTLGGHLELTDPIEPDGTMLKPGK